MKFPIVKLNMKVIINNNVLFEPKYNIIYRTDDHTLHYLLPSSATRLLSEFINKNGILLSRRHLLDHVWRRKGYTASEANLNNAISTLRKGFSELKTDRTIIITIPKKGFQFKANITIQQDNDKPPLVSNAHALSRVKKKIISKNKDGFNNRKEHTFILLVIAAILSALIITAIIESKI